MQVKFVKTENTLRLLSAVNRLGDRGAVEASWCLVKGESGLGKSRNLLWYAIQTGAVHLRAKAGWTPHWYLSDLVTELGVKPERTVEALFAQAVAELVKRQPVVIVDEVEHAMHDGRVLETVRDLSDLVENPVMVAGMDGVERSLARHPQIVSRISEVVDFEPLTVADAANLFDELCEVEVDTNVVAQALEQSRGRMRLMMNAIARVEQLGRKTGTVVALDQVAGVDLAADWSRPGIRRRRRVA